MPMSQQALSPLAENTQQLLTNVAQRAAKYIDALPERRVAPTPGDIDRLELLDEVLPTMP
jgi:hypothetical protein